MCQTQGEYKRGVQESFEELETACPWTRRDSKIAQLLRRLLPQRHGFARSPLERLRGALPALSH